MTARAKTALFMFIAAIVIGACAAVAFRTFATTGEEAIARMTSEERAMLLKLQGLKRGMTLQQVVEVMGPPSESGPLGMRPKWLVGGNPLNGAVVYVHGDGAQRFLWISIGRFTYEEHLRR